MQHHRFGYICQTILAGMISIFLRNSASPCHELCDSRSRECTISRILSGTLRKQSMSLRMPGLGHSGFEFNGDLSPPTLIGLLSDSLFFG
jgi:hypothetical protein